MTDPLELTVYERLSEPFPVEVVHWRVGPTNRKNWKEGDKRRGQPLAYIDARDVMDRLDMVCGPEGWQSDFSDAGNGATCCKIGVLINDTWIWKSDGAGRTSTEGDKGQFSDALKRAAVQHGIGRYLYACEAPWIELDEWWNIPKSADLSAHLEKAGNRQQWGDRNTYNMYRMFREAARSFIQSPEQVEEFIEKNSGVMKQLRVGAKRELENEFNRIIESLKQEKAA